MVSPLPSTTARPTGWSAPPLPDLALPSTLGGELRLADVGALLVAYVYPMTGTPGRALPAGWDDIPGARGCTPQSCAYRDALAGFRELGADLVGISAQSQAEQAEFAGREHIPYPLLSDDGLRLAEALGLPTFEAEGRIFYRRLTFVAAAGRIVKVFYPVFPPDRDAAEVLAWLGGYADSGAEDDRARRDGRQPGRGTPARARARPRGRRGEARRCRRVWLVGTGTSEHAALLGAAMLTGAGLDARAVSGQGFAVAPPRLGADDAVLVISHTATTTFARQAREEALAAGARVVSITGEGKSWPEAIEAAPPERSETYTASYLAALLVLARLAAAAGTERRAPQAMAPRARPVFDPESLAALPALVEAAGAEPTLIERPPPRLTVLFGAGPAAVTAREGALKLREASRVLAEGFESEYLLHGSAVPSPRTTT